MIAISPTDVDSDNKDEIEDEDYEGITIFAAVNQLKDKRKVINIIYQLIVDMVKSVLIWL